jgi:antitoxin ParD1/3/4
MPNVSLGGHFESFIDTQVKTGRFQNASEVVRAGLRLLQDAEMEKAERRAELVKQINAAFDDPRPSNPLEAVFERLEARYQKDVKRTGRENNDT